MRISNLRLGIVTVLAIGAFTLSRTAPAQQDDKRIFVVTHVDLVPPNIADGTKMLVQFAIDSHKEKGSLRFELLRDVSRANHFSLVEIWQDRQAFDAYLGSDTSKRLREKLQPMLGSPFDERLHSLLQ